MTVEEMEDLLIRLNMEVINVRGDEIQAACPAHLERTGHIDRNPSFWINSDTGAFICFSCGFKGGVSSLISYVQDIPFESASDWLISAEGGLSRKLERAIRKPQFEEVTDISEAMLAAFSEPTPDILRGRGLTPSAAAIYGILYDRRKDCWILPIRDPLTGKLWGWQEKGVTGRYFNNYPKGVQKSKALFGYSAYQGGDMVVVESPLDAARLSSVGVSGGVATYGAIVSKSQINVIRGADRVITAMDHDEAGRDASTAFLEASEKYGFECLFFDYAHTDKKDIGGMSKDEIITGLTNAKHRARGLKAIS